MSPATSTSTTRAADAAFEPLDDSHRETLRMLALFERFVERIETGGVDSHAIETARLLDRYFSVDHLQHHRDEEARVFPLLADRVDEATAQALVRLVQDHVRLRADWSLLAPLVRALAAGRPTVDADVLRESLAVFATLVRDHVALEESLIYPQARARMLESSRREARLALVAGR